jgi:hypothetical protein
MLAAIGVLFARSEFEEWLVDQHGWVLLVGGIALLALLVSLLRPAKVDTRLWLSCPRCNSLAPPIGRTRDRYRCPNCRHQFAGARHSR